MIRTKTCEQLKKNKILLVEHRSGIRQELATFLRSLFDVYPVSTIEHALNMLEECSNNFSIIITNMNIHPLEHSLMDGLSLVRRTQFYTMPIPVIVYSNTLHPLLLIEAQSCGTCSVLDFSKPEFKLNLITILKTIINLAEEKQQQDPLNENFQYVTGLLGKVPLVKPIQWNYCEENLYNCFFCTQTNEPWQYANNWVYILQAARNHGHRFYNGSCLITFATKNFQCKNNIQFEIIKPMGQSAVKKTLLLAEELKKISGKPVLIKKITETQIEHFLDSGKCNILPKPISKRLPDQYDDIHPQIIVNLKAFMDNLTSPKLLNFQRNLRKFNQNNYALKNLTPELYNDFIEVVRRWKRSFIKRYQKRKEFTHIPNDDNYYLSPYLPIFDYYAKNIDNKNTLSSITYLDNIPIGFSFLGRISPIAMGMYANIGDTDFEGLAEFMLYQNFTKAYWCGYKYVNFGGTESKFLYQFYKKLRLNSGRNKSIEQTTRYLIYD